MKKMYFATILLSFVMLTFSCGDDDEASTPKAPSLSLSIAQLSVPYEGNATEVLVTAETEWTAFTDDEWIQVEIKDNSNSGVVNISVEANAGSEVRQGTVIIKSGTARAKIDVIQDAKPEEDLSNIVVPEGYSLVWHDEFNDASLSMPDETQWWYECWAAGTVNNELQRYVAGKEGTTTTAEIVDGTLLIHAVKVGSEILSARVNTQESWTYGYFEARLKLPSGKGTWPAFWMMPKEESSWPTCGEIDIMEEVGYDPNVVVSTIHCKSYNHTKGTQKTSSLKVEDAQTAYHVYALEWTEHFIRTFVDGEEMFYFENDGTGDESTWPFNKPFYLKLNLAWGGSWGGAQGVDESCLPATYAIDYVRVFQK